MTSNTGLNQRARVYVAAVVALGAAAVLHSLYSLLHAPVSYLWFLLAGLTLLSGSFTVRIPNVPARLSVSEAFVFAAVLLFGPAAATMIVVLDCLVASFWLGHKSRQLSRVLFNTAAPAIAIWISSTVFYYMAAIPPLSIEPRPILPLVWPLVALALLYFLFNSLLIARAVAFERGTATLHVWRQNFLWLSLNYFSGASVAALLLPYLQPGQQQFLRVVSIFLPLLVISYLTFKTALGRVDDANRHLTQLNRLYLSTIETLAMAIDAKDQITHGHIRRVQIQAVRLAKAVGVNDSNQIRAIEAAALLHDTGKLAVPEYILNKPGPLTAAEFEKMKLHASVGADILSSIDFPYPVVPIVRHHHENWNGSGYPDGLAGAAIPIGARILSVVDCFDALTSDRPYRPRLADKDALRILQERSNIMYDPLVVDTFLKVYATTSIDTPVSATPASLTAITERVLSNHQAESFGESRLDEIAASSEEMLTLFELARALSGRASLSDVSDVILKHLRRIIPSCLSVFYIYDVDADDLVARATLGEHAGLVTSLRIPLGQRLTGWVGANRQTIRNSDPVLDLGECARAITPRPRSCLSTPLVISGELVGVLTLYSANRSAFSENHQRVAEIVAGQVAQVVRQALEFDNTRRTTYRDQLTGLPNLEQLRSFSDSHSALTQEPTSVLYIDVHELRTINNANGCDEGDKVLSHVLTCARKHARPADVLFRYGGDEFVIVLLHTDKPLAQAMADSLRRSVAHLCVPDIPGRDASISVAVASSPADGTSVEELVRAARACVGAAPGVRSRDSSQSSKSVH